MVKGQREEKGKIRNSREEEMREGRKEIRIKDRRGREGMGRRKKNRKKGEQKGKSTIWHPFYLPYSS